MSDIRPATDEEVAELAEWAKSLLLFPNGGPVNANLVGERLLSLIALLAQQATQSVVRGWRVTDNGDGSIQLTVKEGFDNPLIAECEVEGVCFTPGDNTVRIEAHSAAQQATTIEEVTKERDEAKKAKNQCVIELYAKLDAKDEAMRRVTSQNQDYLTEGRLLREYLEWLRLEGLCPACASKVLAERPFPITPLIAQEAERVRGLEQKVALYEAGEVKAIEGIEREKENWKERYYRKESERDIAQAAAERAGEALKKQAESCKWRDGVSRCTVLNPPRQGCNRFAKCDIWQALSSEPLAGWMGREREKAVVERLKLPGHKCRPIARCIPMAEGRDWWLGELLEPIPGYPDETHCLHMKTPEKDVVFGIWRADLEVMAVLAYIVSGYHISEKWVESRAKAFREAALSALGEQSSPSGQ